VIPLREQDYIRQRFAAGLKGRVKIDLFTQHRSSLVIPGREDCTHCKDTEKMLREIAALSDSISLTVRQLTEEPDIASKIGIDRVPGIVLRGPANRPVRFFGIPGGNEFPNLIETVIELSDAKAPVSPETIKSLKRLKDTVSVDVYVTPACPYCPAVVRHAYRLAMASGHIRAAAIEIGEFPRLAEERNVRAVPLTVLNKRIAIPGALDEAQLVEQILRAVAGSPSAVSAAGAKTTAIAATAPAPRQGQSGLILPN
jgi:glutaredoxin-like protein